MPRIGRLVLPGYPHYIVQRGRNRQIVFAGEPDYQNYLNTLTEFKQECCVKVYAYCLMTNHVHLLLEPESVAGLSALMKRLAGRYTRYFNTLTNRKGSLWEGRHKSSVIDGDNYLLRCIRYIEQNPVKAKMVDAPSQYKWSSYNARYDGICGNVLDPRPNINLSGDMYEEFICSSIPQGEQKLIKESLASNQLTGDARFVKQVENIRGRRNARKQA